MSEARAMLPVVVETPVDSGEAVASTTVAMAAVGPQLTLRELGRLLDVATVILNSGMFPTLLNAKQGVVKMLYGREFGLGPIASLKAIDFFQGQLVPTAKFKAALALRAGLRYEVLEHDDEHCRIAWYDRQGRRLGVSWHSDADTVRMGKDKSKSGKDGAWQTHPANMHFWRAVARGVDWFAPHAVQGDEFLTRWFRGATALDDEIEFEEDDTQ